MNSESAKQIQKDNDIIRARAKLEDDFKKLKSRIALLLEIMEVSASISEDNIGLNAIIESSEFKEIKELSK